MTEIIRQNLQFVRTEVTVIPKYLVMTRSTRTLYALMANKVEISFCWVVNALIHHGPCECVAVSVLIRIRWEKPTRTIIKTGTIR